MSKYTVEQVDACILCYKSGDLNYCRQGIVDLLTDYATLLRERESAKAVVTDAVVSGALFDFLGYLTSRDEAVTTSCSHGAGPAVRALEEWAAKRSLALDDADVRGWREAIALMLASESSEELKEWEEFGRQIEKRLRYNTWGFKGSYPEIIDRIIKLASTRVPSKMGTCGGIVDEQYVDGWNACRDAMLAAAPKPETEE